MPERGRAGGKAIHFFKLGNEPSPTSRQRQQGEHQCHPRLRFLELRTFGFPFAATRIFHEPEASAREAQEGTQTLSFPSRRFGFVFRHENQRNSKTGAAGWGAW